MEVWSEKGLGNIIIIIAVTNSHCLFNMMVLHPKADALTFRSPNQAAQAIKRAKKILTDSWLASGGPVLEVK